MDSVSELTDLAQGVVLILDVMDGLLLRKLPADEYQQMLKSIEYARKLLNKMVKTSGEAKISMPV